MKTYTTDSGRAAATVFPSAFWRGLPGMDTLRSYGTLLYASLGVMTMSFVVSTNSWYPRTLPIMTARVVLIALNLALVVLIVHYQMRKAQWAIETLTIG